MKFGMDEDDFRVLRQHLILPLQARDAKIFIFGSRARGDHQPFSDVDILLIEDPKAPIDHEDIAEILSTMEESLFPYQIDLVKQSDLAESYKHKVQREMIALA